MRLEERKVKLLSCLSRSGVNAVPYEGHDRIVVANSNRIWILGNFGNQVTFNGTKSAIHHIIQTPIKDIKLHKQAVDFFAIPNFAKDTNGKRIELCTSWCFLPAETVYQSIKDYRESGDSTWKTNPERDWQGNINNKNFFWKSDESKARYDIQWDNYIDLKPIENNPEDDIESDIDEINADDSLCGTEKQTLIKARRGQGAYRNKLIKYWSSCSVTGCKDVSLLIASHIKPWKLASNKERLDMFNGLLLIPNLDALFDKGLISFNDTGTIIYSDQVNAETKSIFGVDKSFQVNIKEQHKEYLEFHRKYVLK
ncbi:HNH endonuclease [Vibrio splendidus]